MRLCCTWGKTDSNQSKHRNIYGMSDGKICYQERAGKENGEYCAILGVKHCYFIKWSKNASLEATFEQRPKGSKGISPMGEKQPRKRIRQVQMSWGANFLGFLRNIKETSIGKAE